MDALAAVRSRAEADGVFDFAVVDYLMPQMDGVELARAMAGDPARPSRVVMLTSSVWSEDRALATAAGIDAFLAKPVRSSALYDCLVTVGGLDADAPIALITDSTLADARSSRTAHVLVVEDNLVNQQIAATMLETMGHRVDRQR